MNKTVESHIILLLGAATRNSSGNNKRYLNIYSERLLYVIFFLMTEDHKKLRTKLYYFKKGKEIPESDVLKNCLRNPRYHKDCWEITETGITLTEKGIDRFRGLMRHNSEIMESFIAILSEIIMNNISLPELEKIVQLKHPNYATKYVDMIDMAVKANPKLNRDELLKQLQSSDYIHELVQKAIFVNMVETRKYGKGTITQA